MKQTFRFIRLCILLMFALEEQYGAGVVAFLLQFVLHATGGKAEEERNKKLIRAFRANLAEGRYEINVYIIPEKGTAGR